MLEVVTNPVDFVLLDTPIVLAIAGLLVVAAGLLCAAAVIGLRSRRLQQRRDREQRLKEICGEAKTIVDLTTPTAGCEPLTTPALRSLMDRIQQLDRRLMGLLASTSDQRSVEAIEDARLVAVSLGAALEAERSLRVETADDSPWRRAESLARISRRSAELDLTATKLLWIAETT